MGKLFFYVFRIGSRHIDLIDGNKDRHFRILRMVDRFQRLRHDPVIRRYNNHGDIGDLGPTYA